MKVRVLKDMPFAKVGEVYGTDKEISITMDGIWIHTANIEQWIANGWLEEVKDESWVKRACPHCVDEFEQKMLSGAKEHSLEVLDRVIKDIKVLGRTSPGEVVDKLRKAIEEA